VIRLEISENYKYARIQYALECIPKYEDTHQPDSSACLNVQRIIANCTTDIGRGSAIHRTVNAVRKGKALYGVSLIDVSQYT
jgi:hypothetical protein